MTDKLRELAERWKSYDRDETLYVMGFRAASHSCADELLAILDAEGDGGASDEDVRYMAIGRAIERGAKELPEGYQLSVYIEKDAGTADLQDPDGDNVFFESDEWLAGSINAAIDAAMQGESHE